MNITINLSAKHFRNASKFSDPNNCPLSLALKEKFKTNNVIVGGNCAIVNNTFYTTDWNYFQKGKSVNTLIALAKKKQKVGNYTINLNLKIASKALSSLYNN